MLLLPGPALARSALHLLKNSQRYPARWIHAYAHAEHSGAFHSPRDVAALKYPLALLADSTLRRLECTWADAAPKAPA